MSFFLANVLQGLHPVLKAFLYLVLISAVLLAPVQRTNRSLPLLCLLLLLPLISPVSIPKLLRAIIRTIPLIFLLTLSRLLVHHSREAAWYFGLVLVLKMSAVLLVTFTWASLLSIQELAALMRQCRLPNSFTAVLFFGLRYFGLFSEEMNRFERALKSRAPMRLGWGRRIRTIMHGTAHFFLRAFSRSEKIYAAMLSRGFTGSLEMLPFRTIRAVESLVVLIFSVAVLGVVLWL